VRAFHRSTTGSAAKANLAAFPRKARAISFPQMADAAQAGAQAQMHRSTAALLRLHDGYGQRLQSASDDLLDHYAAMLKASRLIEVCLT
jgi:hypothetical protein